MAENDSTKDYNESVRANLPAGMTYNSDINRYVVNGKNWFSYRMANWYLTYLLKFGYSAGNYVLFIPSGSDSLITSDGNTFKVREA